MRDGYVFPSPKRTRSTRILPAFLCLLALCAGCASRSGPGASEDVADAGRASTTRPRAAETEALFVAKSDMLRVLNRSGEQITRYAAHGAKWALSPRGEKVVYSADGEVRTCDLGGRNDRLLCRAQAVSILVWSPDGEMVAFEAREPRGLSIARVGRAGGELTTFPDLSPAHSLAWSPSGKSLLAYSRQRVSKPVILSVADGSTQQVAATPGAFPTWSPNGRFIACVSQTSAGFAVAVVNTATSEVTPVTPPLGHNFGALSWSPDGKHIAFLADMQGEPGIHVWACNTDGSDCRQVILNAVYLHPEYPPQWSPDAKLIAYVGKRDNRVVLARADGRSVNGTEVNGVPVLWCRWRKPPSISALEQDVPFAEVPIVR